jgi:hypothetical protein
MYQGPTVSTVNPYASDTAAGIAWEVAKTGGGTDLRMNVIAEAEVRAAGGDPSFITYATDIYAERPQYSAQTLVTRTGQTFVNQPWSGVPIRLNLTLSELAGATERINTSPGKYYQYRQETRLLTPITSPVTIGADPGIHKAYGDFGGPILASDGSYGGWTRKVPTFSQAQVEATSYDVTYKNLPTPFISTVGSSQLSTVSQISEKTSVLRPSDIDLLAMQANIPVVSGAVVAASDFFIGGRTTLTTEKTESGTATTPTPVLSGFEYGESQFSQKVSKAYLPALAYTPTDYASSFAQGAYEGIREKPLTAGISFGVGLGVTALTAGFINPATESAVAATAGTRIAPFASAAGTFITKVAPAALTGLYSIDVVGRTTKWGSDFSPAAAGRFGSIASTEVIPMVAGGLSYSPIKSGLSSVGKVMAGDIAGTTVTRPPALYEVVAPSRSISGRVSEVKTTAIQKIGSFRYRQYQSTARTEDIYTISVKSTENVMSVSGRGVDFEVTKISQEYARPSIKLPVIGKTTIPFTTAKPIGEPIGPTTVKAGTLAYEYATARYPSTEGITGDFFAREYIVRTSEYRPGGFVQAREEIFGAESRTLMKGSKEYLTVWDLAGEQSAKTGKSQVALFNKMIKTPDGYRSGSMAFGRTSEGVTLRNVWEKGTVITEARPSSEIQLNQVRDISPYVYSAERTDITSVKGAVVGMERIAVTRELGVSEAGVPSFESDIGITRKVSAYSGEQPAYETGRTSKASTVINTILGSSFPAKGKPVIGEYQGIVQNALDRLTIANTMKGSIGRPEGLKIGAGSIEELNVAAKAISEPARGGMKNIWAFREVTRAQAVKPLPDWYKEATGTIAIQKEPQQAISYSQADISRQPAKTQSIESYAELLRGPSPSYGGMRYAVIEEEPEYISAFVTEMRNKLGLATPRGSYTTPGVIVSPVTSSRAMQTVSPSQSIRNLINNDIAQKQFSVQKSASESMLGVRSKSATLTTLGIDSYIRIDIANDITQIPGTGQLPYQEQVPAQITAVTPRMPPATPPTGYPDLPITPFINKQLILLPQGISPILGGAGSSSGYGRGRSWVNVHAVGADLMAKFRGAAAPKISFRAPKFKFPKF